MKRHLISLFFISSLLFVSAGLNAQTVSVTIQYGGAQAWGCCNVCGQDYMCIGGSGCGCCQASQQTKTFANPVPAGNIITAVTITFYAADCSHSYVACSINGVYICNAVNSGPHTCVCGSCNQQTCTASFPCGLSGYNYAGNNTFYANVQPSYSEICPDRVVLTFTYAPAGSGGVPAQPGAITGPLSVCPGQTVTYSISAVPNATSYNWTVPAGAVINSGQGTTSITVTFGSNGGQVCVTASNICGSSVARCVSVSIAPPPNAPGPISGPQSVCPGQTFTYAISAVAGATSYNWTVPPGAVINSGQGSTQISVTFGSSTGSICVTASNGCGTSAPTCLPISLAPPPSAPSAISGTTSVCPGQTFTYTISAVSGATSYTWTVPPGAVINSGQGTTSISVTFGSSAGQICVSASNSCGSSAPTCVNITLAPPPAQPGAITGPGTVCAGSTQTYSITAVAGATSYNWTVPAGSTISSGQGTTSITVSFGSTSGNVCVNASNACGSSSYTCRPVTVVALPILTVTPSNPSLCTGNSVQLQASGATSYTWSPSTGLSNAGISNPVASPSVTTTYTVTGNTSGCTASATVTVTVNTTPVVTVSPASPVICAGNSVQLTAGGATTYSWSPVSGLSNPNIANPLASPTSTTTYTITGSIGNCSATASITVTVNPSPTANAGADQSIGVCASSVAQLNGTGTGSPPLSFSWSPSAGLSNPGIFNPIANPSTTTTYTLTVTNSYGCTATDAMVVNVNPLPQANAGQDQSIGACAQSSAALNGSGTGSNPLSYSWSPATGLSNPNIPNPVASPTTTTTYTLTVTDVYGCTATDNIVITVSSLPSANAGNDGSIGSCAASSYQINGSGSGTAPLIYSWSPQAGLSNPSVANPVAQPGSTTTYTLTVTDAYGCSASDAVVVTVNALPVANAGSDQSIGSCAASSVTLSGSGSGSGPLVYSWSPQNGLSNAGISNPVAQPTSTTTYTLTVTDVFGCTATDNVIVTVNSLPVASAGQDGNIGYCSTSTMVLNGSGSGSGPLSFSWSPSTGLSNSGIATPTANPSVTTTYTLTVTDVYGCTATDNVVVTVNALPVANAGPDQQTGSCITSTVTLNGSGSGSGPLSYSWTPVAGLSVSNIPNPIASPTSTTTYTLMVTDIYGCTATDNVIVTVNALPVANAGSNLQIGNCASSSANINGSGSGSGPLQYAWSPVNGLSNPSIPNPVAQPASTTTYTLTVTDVYGCTATDDVTITVNPLPTVSAGNDTTIGSCVSSVAVLQGSGSGYSPLSYSWSPTSGLSNPSIPTPTAHPASTTTYTLMVTDGFGCSASDGVTVTIAPLPVANAGIDDTTGGCSGSSATLSGSGTGTSPLTYLWNPPAGLSNPAISNPVAQPPNTTTYTLIVTDFYGCTATDIVLIIVEPGPTANAGQDQSIGLCNTSTAQLSAIGTGPGPLSYSWLPVTGLSDPSIPNPVANPSSTTTYTLIVSDIYGCSATDMVVINVVPLPVVGVNPPAATICDGFSVILNASGALAYLWSPSAGLNTTTDSVVIASPSTSTTYTVTGSDMFGCTASAAVTVNVSSNPSISILPASPAVCQGGSIILTAGGASTYSWSPAATLSAATGAVVTAQPLLTTTYTVTGFDNGCSSTATVTVTVHPLPAVTFGALSPVCSNEPSFILISGTPAGGTYSGTGVVGGTTFDAMTAGPGTHLLTYQYTDQNGCSNSATQNITVIAVPAVTVTPDNTNICYSASAILTASGATSYTWSPPSGLSSTTGASVSASPQFTTVYTVTGINGSCSATATATVNVYSVIPVYVSPSSATVCPGSSVVLTASGANSYSWSPATGLSAVTGAVVAASPNTTTTYTVTGTDLYGCTGYAVVTVDIYSDAILNFSATPRYGCAPLLTDFLFPTGAGIDYSSLSWNFGDYYSVNNAAGGNNPSHLYEFAGEYVVTLTAFTLNGCAASGSDTIRVDDVPVAAFSYTPELVDLDNPEYHFIDQSLHAYYWYWNFGDPSAGSAAVSELQFPQHTYSDTGRFLVTLIVAGPNGCQDTAYEWVRVVDPFNLFIPNAFTPDGDGNNEIFLPKGFGFDFSTYELLIFDRWGKKIWHSRDYFEGWNGTDMRSGNSVSQGVYTYMIRVNEERSSIKRVFHGSVTVLPWNE